MHIFSFFLVLHFFFISCSHSSLDKNDFPRFSENINTEAEKYFYQASILWKQEDSLFQRESEKCSNPLKAIKLLNKVIKIEPTYAEALIKRGMAKSDIKDFPGAFDDITTAIRLQPTPRNYAIRGLISLRGRSLMAAHKDLEYSLQLNNKQTEAWNYLAMVDILEEKEASACNNFRKACKNGDCTRLKFIKSKGMCSD